ncbi:hypothetical protein ACVW1A_000935 [Bradyrhizobium sp. LB1.3]
MASNFDQQLFDAWNEYEAFTGEPANNPDDFLVWALETKKLAPGPQDIRKIFRRAIGRVLRQATRMDDAGFSYRAKQSLILMDESGRQYRMVFDTDSGGTPNLRQKATRQRRDAVASDVYRAVCDVEHMNKTFPDEPQLNFWLDFAEDVAERRAADLLNRDKDDDEDDQDEAA